LNQENQKFKAVKKYSREHPLVPINETNQKIVWSQSRPRNDIIVWVPIKRVVIARAFPTKNKRVKPEANFDVVILGNNISLSELHVMANVSKIGLVKTEYFVYIMTNKGNRVLYTGVTSDLEVRCMEHISKKHPDSFTARYNVNKLVYYERFERIDVAIAREKQIKGGSRKKKIALIELMNPYWNDLYETKIANRDN
jgi:putative endonuclease